MAKRIDELLSEARQRQEEAVRFLLEALLSSASRAARHARGSLDPVVRAEFDTSDVASSVARVMWARIDHGAEFESLDHLLNYAAQVARNKVRDRVRKSVGRSADGPLRPRRQGDGVDPNHPSAGGDPSAEVEARELLRFALSGLSAVDSIALRLRLEGRDWDEVCRTAELVEAADCEGAAVNPAAISKRVQRALVAVRARLGEQAGDGA